MQGKLAKQGTESVTPIIAVLQQDGQREPILISSSGIVVNGNRRLSAMRELLRKADGSVDERFTNIRCAVLPPDVSRDEIDDIEADLQARPQTKLDYDWIGDARLIRRQVDKGRSTKEVADRLRRSKADIENVLQALDEADLYLSEWIEKPGEYERVQEGQQIFGDLPKSIARKDANLQNASRAIAWSIYENRDKITGRLYRLNAAFGKLAPKVLEILEEQLDLSDSQAADVEDDDFAIDIDGDEATKDYTAIADHYYAKPEPVIDAAQRIEHADAFFTATGADVRHGGNRAFYSGGTDHVQMPPFECFRSPETYYATLAHELTHWTKHKTRLDREFGRKRWGDEGYAREEMVAELGAAFLCADLGLTPEAGTDHAAYIQSWLKVLKDDKRAIFSAAAHAQRAADFLHGCQQPQQEGVAA